MTPPRNRARTPETLTNEQLAQNLHQSTQIAQALSNNLLNNNNHPPPNRNCNVACQVLSHRPHIFDGEENPVILEEWIRTFDKIFEVLGCLEERRVELASFYFGLEANLWWIHEGPVYRQESEYHKRFLELARFAHVLVPTETTKVEKFVAGLNFEARKTLTINKPRTLNDAYSSAANLYQIQQLQRGTQKQAKRKNNGSGGPNLKRPRNNSNVRETPQQAQGPPRGNNEAGWGKILCRRCGRDHRGKDCQGNALRCFNYGEGGHKAFQCNQPARARPPPTGQQGNTNNRGGYGAPGKVIIMSRTQAEAETRTKAIPIGDEDEDLTGNPFCCG
ncbi:PREDICTED: uncharacterized protein LOC109153499 [Ipomoea nil]|uniref:uncharacterized protein LOC109153499 n=1 Tax=Ipomoea nil TaxID=35883 RepID=UPI0009016083|nr:PREDICTED: uncharacterized protein LOC109153499 [Ipomoea nil]